MELTPEERQHIYAQEKARLEVRAQLESGIEKAPEISSPSGNHKDLVRPLMAISFWITIPNLLFNTIYLGFLSPIDLTNDIIRWRAIPDIALVLLSYFGFIKRNTWCGLLATGVWLYSFGYLIKSVGLQYSPLFTLFMALAVLVSSFANYGIYAEKKVPSLPATNKAEMENKSKVIGLLFVLFLGPLGLAYTSVKAAVITIAAILLSIVLIVIFPPVGILGCALAYLSIFVTFVKLSKNWKN